MVLGFVKEIIDAVVVDTPILDRDIREQIRDVDNIMGRLRRAELFRNYLDSHWQHCTEAGIFFDWIAVSGNLSEDR